jgi:hypothetical protein
MNHGVNPFEYALQAFGAADVGLHYFGIEVSQHKTAHGSPDHQPRVQATLGKLSRDFDTDKPGGTGDQYPLHASVSSNG